MIKIVGVRFRNAGKVYYFDPKDIQLRMGDHVIVETSRGQEYGTVSTGMKMVEDDQVSQPLREVVRKATEEDEQKICDIRTREKEALRVCREKVREHELEMKVVDAEYAFDGSKMLFYFTADGRVDFRELVKDLAGVFHMRIELRQIGVRDETRMLGGIGTCGRELCCATYLREFQPVSIKMAKEQNLSLNPAKISGACGRLMCCLKNEAETYEYLNAKMPKLGEEAITADGQVGKVVELDVLRQRVRVLFEEEDSKEIEMFPVEQLTFRPRKRKDPSAQGKDKGRKGDRGGQEAEGPEKSVKEKAPAGQSEAREDGEHGEHGEHKKRQRRRKKKEGATAEGRSEAKSEGRSEAKSEGRSEAKSEGRSEAKTEGRSEAKSEGRSEAKSEGRSEAKTEGRGEARPEGRNETRTEAAGAERQGADGETPDGGEKNGGRRRRRRRPHRSSAEHREGRKESPKPTSEMRIYADSKSGDE